MGTPCVFEPSRYCLVTKGVVHVSARTRKLFANNQLGPADGTVTDSEGVRSIARAHSDPRQSGDLFHAGAEQQHAERVQHRRVADGRYVCQVWKPLCWQWAQRVLRLQKQNCATALKPAWPMNRIDPRTVILLGGVMSGLMSLGVVLAQAQLPGVDQGFGSFGRRRCCWFSWVACWSPDWAPCPTPSSSPCPACWSGSGRPGPMLAASTSLVSRPVWHRAQADRRDDARQQLWFTVVQPSYHVRLVLANLLAANLFTVHAYLVLKQGSATLARVLTTGVLLVMAVIQVMRLVTSFICSMGQDILVYTSPLQLVYVTSFVFCILLLSIGLGVDGDRKLARRAGTPGNP